VLYLFEFIYKLKYAHIYLCFSNFPLFILRDDNVVNMRTHNVVMIRIPVRLHCVSVARARFFTSVSLGLSSECVVVVNSRESTLNARWKLRFANFASRITENPVPIPSLEWLSIFSIDSLIRVDYQWRARARSFSRSTARRIPQRDSFL